MVHKNNIKYHDWHLCQLNGVRAISFQESDLTTTYYYSRLLTGGPQESPNSVLQPPIHKLYTFSLIFWQMIHQTSLETLPPYFLLAVDPLILFSTMTAITSPANYHVSRYPVIRILMHASLL